VYDTNCCRHGFPQLSAIFEVTATGLPVIADGGIQTTRRCRESNCCWRNMCDNWKVFLPEQMKHLVITPALG